MAANPSERDTGSESVETDTVGHVHIGDGADRPTAAVTEAIARATGERPDRETLREAVDPGALDALFAESDGSRWRGGTVSFVAGGCVVSIQADGGVVAAALD